MKQPIRVRDVVALTEDIPDRSLLGGQIGTVVEELVPGEFEVECSDSRSGHAFAMLSLKAEQLLALRESPMRTV